MKEKKDRRDLISLEEAMELIEKTPLAEKPGGFYCESGDCLFMHTETVEYFARQVSENVTVYYALDDSRIVGVRVDGPFWFRPDKRTIWFP